MRCLLLSLLLLISCCTRDSTSWEEDFQDALESNIDADFEYIDGMCAIQGAMSDDLMRGLFMDSVLADDNVLNDVLEEHEITPTREIYNRASDIALEHARSRCP